MVEATRRLSVGDPEESGTFVGAINTRAHLDKIRRYVGYAAEDGGQVS